MFSEPKMSEADLNEYANQLKTKTDDDYIAETAEQIIHAGYYSRYTSYDQKATKCWEEGNRRKKPWLYQRAYNKALNRSGVRPTERDIESASESYYAEK